MSEPLLVVDTQRGFMNEFTRHVAPRIQHLVARGDYSPVLFTRFINVDGSPYRTFLDWKGSARPPETEIVDELVAFATPHNMYEKRGLTGLPKALSERARSERWPHISIVGVDTDMCVLKIAMDVFDLGIEPIVLVDCCASTAGLQAHLAGLAILSRNIGPHQLRLTDLHEGYLAGPGGDPTPSDA